MEAITKTIFKTKDEALRHEVMAEIGALIDEFVKSQKGAAAQTRARNTLYRFFEANIEAFTPQEIDE